MSEIGLKLRGAFVKNEIMVSITCITYNHEKFIADAIESFLMQKTNFKFEILIHDDSSTDQTALIIKKYEEKYPDLIKSIYQIENQYSQGIDVDELNTRRAQGKYIAVCEGDDYWTDPDKLQKQFEYMEAHFECSLCVHNACIVNSFRKKKKCVIECKRSRNFSVDEIIEGGGALFATSSIFYPRYLDNGKPRFYKIAPVGDYPLVIHLALKGTVHYIAESMSAYRIGIKGSWTNREMATLNQRVKHFDEISKMLDEVNSFTNYQYASTIKYTKHKNQFKLMIEQGKFNELKHGNYLEIYNNLNKRDKIKIFIKQHFPYLIKTLQPLRSKYK